MSKRKGKTRKGKRISWGPVVEGLSGVGLVLVLLGLIVIGGM